MAIQLGQVIGRYRIVEKLGEGGMATVYRAYDNRLKKDVAIKFIRRAAFSEEMMGQVLARFEHEAVSLARLTHPNIIPIIDYDQYEDSPYLVMPYLPGGALRNLLSKIAGEGRVMSPADAARLLVPIARALEYAHQRGVLHRDVKSANILMTESGEPMLADFGIARIFGEEGTMLTATGASVGSPENMAPEQWIGKAVPASDQYSLGVVLYEMITGRKPFTGDTPPEVMLKHINEPLPPPRRYVSSLPKAIEKVLNTALAKKAEDRYPSMAAFAEALQSIGEQPGREITFHPAPQPKPAQPVEETIDRVSEPVIIPKQPKRPFYWKIGTGIIGALVVLALGIWLAASGIFGNPGSTPTAQATTVGTQVSNVEQGRTPTERVTPAFTMTTAPIAADTSTKTPEASPAPALPPVISLDNAKQLTERLRVDAGSYVAVAISPDIQLLAYTDEDTVRIVRLSDGKGIQTLVGHKAKVRSIQFSPDGQMIGSGSEDGEVKLWSTADGAEIQFLRDGFTSGFSIRQEVIAFSPDGKYLAETTAYQYDGKNESRAILWNIADGEVIRSFPWQDDNYTSALSFSPDGKIVMIARGSGAITIWNVDDGSTGKYLKWSYTDAYGAAFSPDGTVLATGTSSGTIHLWRVGDGSEIGSLNSSMRFSYNVLLAFSPDGKLLASNGDKGTVQLWNFENNSELFSLQTNDEYITSLIFSPDGRAIVTASFDGSIRVWEVGGTITP